MKALICILVVFCCSFIHAAERRLDNLTFRHFSTSEGLPNNMVHHIYQDRDGFIWISTFYGLFRYDGYEVRTYKSNLYTPGLLANNNVLCVAEDRSHHLWIGTHEGLCMLDKRTGDMRRMKLEGIDRHRVNEILVSKGNQVYCGYIRGVACYDEQRDTLLLMTRKNSKGTVPERVNVQAMLEDEQGDLLIGTWQDGLYRYAVKTRTFTHYPQEEVKSVLSLFQDSRGVIWIGTNGNGLLKARFSSDKKLIIDNIYRHEERNPHSLSSDYVYAIHEDLETRSLWCGTRNGVSILPLDGEPAFIRYNERSAGHFLPVNEVSSVLRDRNGLMWIGTKRTGIFHTDTRASAFRVFYRQDTVSLAGVTTLYVDDNDALWTGLEYGVDYVSDAGRVRLLPSKRLYHISHSPLRQTVLLAVHDGGIVECKQGKVIRSYTRQGCGFIPHDLVYWVHEDRKGNWWAGTYWGLGVRYRDGREYCLNHFHKQLAKEITCIAEDHDGSLWLATNNDGIIHLAGDMERPESLRCKEYRIENGGLPSNTPLCFRIDKSGRVWAGTDGSGLCLYDAQEDCFHSVHRRYYLPGDMVASIEDDDYGHLWLGTNQGLARLTTLGNEKGRVRVFTVADGLLDNFFSPNASFRKGKTFYFGCNRGINTFDSEAITENVSDVTLRITDILLDNRSVESMPAEERDVVTPFAPDFTKRLTIPSSYTNFSICFASLTYNQPRQNGYAYRLHGFDEDWRYAGADNRNARYTKLPPGTYTFELRATNENGDWGEPRSMEIVVEPPFWATWWAYLMYLLLFISFLGFIRWMVYRRLMQHNLKSLQEGETDKMHHLKLQFVSSIPSEDEKFLQDAIACVKRHLDDPDFDVSQFVEEMSVSRTSLHKKLKSLTGQNTTGFIRSIRLKAACSLMDADPHIRISDLAYKVGFNDPKYFSICFKKEFGMQPTEYLNRAGKRAE